MNFPPPTKAEILLTRGCNLDCSYCALKTYNAKATRGLEWTKTNELSDSEWAFVPEKLKEMGVPFAPIYGAEPLTRMSALTFFLEKCKKEDIPTTVITNGTLLENKIVSELVEAGLESITLSHDIVPANKTLSAKTKVADLLIKRLTRRFKDVAVVTTLNRKNISLLPEFIKRMSQKNVWVCMDIYHPDRKQEGSKCKSYNSNLAFRHEDATKCFSVITQVHLLKRVGYKIHPTVEYFLAFMNQYERYVLNYGWKCRSGPWITVDSDGSVFGCDDYKPESFRNKFNILQFNDTWTWEVFVKAWSKELKYCPGCFWSTHFMSDQWWEQSGWLKDQTHGRKK